MFPFLSSDFDRSVQINCFISTSKIYLRNLSLSDSDSWIPFAPFPCKSFRAVKIISPILYDYIQLFTIL